MTPSVALHGEFDRIGEAEFSKWYQVPTSAVASSDCHRVDRAVFGRRGESRRQWALAEKVDY